MTQPETVTAWDDLVRRAEALAAGPQRRLLGITGAPGAGKSTVAEALVEHLGPDRARLVGMDAFHFAQVELHRQGTNDRKGAPFTFDAAGYVALLARLRDNTEPVVYAPYFDRSIEEAINCGVPVPQEVPLVVTEGNYLLVEDGGWGGVRPMLDECWFVAPPEDVRIERLVLRHERYGRSHDEALGRTHGSDQSNADVVAATLPRADLVYVAG